MRRIRCSARPRGLWKAAVLVAASVVGIPISATAAPHVVDTLAIVSSSLPSATQGAPYSTALDASGGTTPYTWSLLTGAVPLGLVLNSSGSLAGIPGTAGTASIAVRVTDATGYAVTGTVDVVIAPAPPPPQQVVIVSAHGSATTFAAGALAPSVEAVSSSDVVAVTSAPNGSGSWCVTRNGRVITVGAVQQYGDVPKRVARGNVVGIASNATGTGYWIVTKTGHVFGFGAARSHGSLRKAARRGIVVGIARTNENGYYIAESSGRVVGFGSGWAKGSVRARRLRVHIAAITSTPSGKGFWMVATNGRVFSFGVARGLHVSGPQPSGTISGIATANNGIGYYLVARTGAVFSYGSALAVTPLSLTPGDIAVGVSVAD